MEKNPEIEEMMSGSYYYEDKRVGKTRKSKSCAICGRNIPTGTGHLALKLFNGEFYDANICSACEDKYKSELIFVRNCHYDNY